MHYEHRKGVAEYCQMSRSDFMPLCDWYVMRPEDGGYMGFKAHPSGGAKVLAIAHLDYLRSGKVHKCNRKTIISSALDDRVGAYIALNLLDEYGIKADVLLTDFEEQGDSTVKMIGAGLLQKYNWIVQLDRKGEDVVTYGFTEMKEYLEEFWTVGHGSFSDISELENICPVSAFNMGVAYHQEHSEKCHLSWKVLARQMRRLRAFYDKYKDHKFERTHDAGEIFDHPKSRGWNSGNWCNYQVHKGKSLPAITPVVTAPRFDSQDEVELCGFCGGPFGPTGVRLSPHGKFEICEWCAQGAPPGQIKADDIRLLECDMCSKYKNTSNFLEAVGWWVCDECNAKIDGSVRIIGGE